MITISLEYSNLISNQILARLKAKGFRITLKCDTTKIL